MANNSFSTFIINVYVVMMALVPKSGWMTGADSTFFSCHTWARTQDNSTEREF